MYGQGEGPDTLYGDEYGTYRARDQGIGGSRWVFKVSGWSPKEIINTGRELLEYLQMTLHAVVTVAVVRKRRNPGKSC